MRKTQALGQVLMVLMEDPDGRHWGYDVGKRARLRSGVLYPILHRMLEEGWLEDGWEDQTETNGRPARRYYELTPDGQAMATEVLREMQQDVRFGTLLGGMA